MKTLYDYFVKKIKTHNQFLRSEEKSLMQYASDLNIKNIESCASRIRELHKDLEVIVKEIFTWLDIEQIAKLVNEKESTYSSDGYYENSIITKNHIQKLLYQFKYNGYGVTVQDRDTLVNLFGRDFKDIKLK